MPRRILLMMTAFVFGFGCSLITGPTETFHIRNQYLYCNQATANSKCREMGYSKAASFKCTHKTVMGWMGAPETMHLITDLTCKGKK